MVRLGDRRRYFPAQVSLRVDDDQSMQSLTVLPRPTEKTVASRAGTVPKMMVRVALVLRTLNGVHFGWRMRRPGSFRRWKTLSSGSARRLIRVRLTAMRHRWWRVVGGKRNVHMLLRGNGKPWQHKDEKERGQSQSRLHLSGQNKEVTRAAVELSSLPEVPPSTSTSKQ
jgi:hypothetical protein